MINFSDIMSLHLYLNKIVAVKKGGVNTIVPFDVFNYSNNLSESIIKLETALNNSIKSDIKIGDNGYMYYVYKAKELLHEAKNIENKNNEKELLMNMGDYTTLFINIYTKHEILIKPLGIIYDNAQLLTDLTAWKKIFIAAKNKIISDPDIIKHYYNQNHNSKYYLVEATALLAQADIYI